MQQHFEHRFDAAVADVVAMYADTDFAYARAEATGAVSSDVVLDGKPTDGAFTLAIRRTMPTRDIQAEFRGFLGDTIGVRYTEAWEPAGGGEEREATYAVEIIGAPARSAGTITVSPDGDGSVIVYDGTVTCSMPFLQQLIVSAVADALERGIAAELEAADQWLASR